MRAALDITGQTFGRLTAVEPVRRNGRLHWRCRCECGRETVASSSNLRGGFKLSCGCLHAPHGHRSGGLTSREYQSWQAMRSRCYRPEHHAYARYGGRGITVCDAWVENFEAFLADMGPRPEGTSLERVDNSKGYGPGNCVWATKREQQRNVRTNRLLTFGGRTQCLTAWAEECDLRADTLAFRLNHGWSVERALTTAVRGAA